MTDLLLVVILNTLENEEEHLVDHIHDLVIIIFESHLKVEASEFGQVPVGVRVLSPEDGADLVYPLHISSDSHLLSQLGRLRQESRTTEIVDLEHGRAGLSSSGLEFGRLDLGEPLGIEECSEEVGDTGANTKDGVGDRGTEVNNSVGETSSLADTRIVGVWSGKLGEGTTGIFDLEWKRGGGSRNHMKLWVHRRVSRA
jgi:hypothetical protein